MRPVRPRRGPVLDWLRTHGHHLVFGFALLSLATLVTWWAVFIRASIERERVLTEVALRATLRVQAMLLGRSEVRPVQGPLDADPRLEITAGPWRGDELCLPLEPAWPDLHVQVRAEALGRSAEAGHRRTVMVLGESSLVVVLLFVSCLMLYRLIWADRRSTAEINELWSRVTHEIKTPITGIKAFLQTLGRRDLEPEELRRSVEMALRQVSRQERLAENLLVGQRLGREQLSPRRVDLGVFLRHFLEEHALILAGRTVRACAPDGLEVMADVDALQAILGNLADNAARYGGEGLELDITVEACDQRVAIVFSDNGPGFDPRRQEELFQAYRRLEPARGRATRGTGLGLYISRRLARRMGGELTASTAGPGLGARFRLELGRAGGRNSAGHRGRERQ